MGLYDFSLYDIIVRNAVIFQNRPAWQDPDQQSPLTFGQVKQRVDRMALSLRRLGCRKGDRIGVMGKNCLEFFVVYGAAAALGAIVLPVNWRLSDAEAAYVLNDGAPQWVLADDDNPQWVTAVRARLPQSVRFFNLQPGRGPLEEIPQDSSASELADPESVSRDDGFVIIHTAAVSGHPRGALLSQGNLLCAHMHLMHVCGLTPTDVHLSALPLFHVAGLFMTFCAYHAGCLNISLPKFDAECAVRLIADQKVSLMFTFAPMLKSILDAQSQSAADISALRCVIGLDAPEVIEHYQAVAGGTFHVMYGQTETSMLASIGPYNNCPGSAGRPIGLSMVQLMDDRGQPVPVGEVGEIVMRGPMVFNGYWGLREDNARTFRHGWHHTGDLGRLDSDGYLWYAGRKADKELIKPGGENVYPAEVEKAILDHPDVEAVVVFGVPDPKWKEGIKAVCVLSEGKHLSAKELIAFVGGRIARYKKPQYVEFVTALPLTAGGAIDRRKAKELWGGLK
jgi:acyl-CoA synthetase (AMP-forming)/AMP-acid ligase II